jgi:hypothetical protein
MMNKSSRIVRSHSHRSEDYIEMDLKEDPHAAPPQIPNGFDPMGEIYLRGHAARNLASGSVGWWAILAGWILLGLFTSCLLLVAIAGESPHVLFLFIGAIIPTLILCRGTLAKLRRRR